MIGPKCQLCKKQLTHHHSETRHCPTGKRTRNFGFGEFHESNRFQAKEPSKGGASEKRKDRNQRRLTKSEPCCACFTRGTDWNPVDPAHIRTFKVTQSDHPANMIPLCRECHRTQHNDGWRIFLEANPHVRTLLESKGWEIYTYAFDETKICFTHREFV